MTAAEGVLLIIVGGFAILFALVPTTNPFIPHSEGFTS